MARRSRSRRRGGPGGRGRRAGPPRLPADQTNWFDRLFIAIYIGVALELLWMRFLEAAIPLWVCHIIVIALGVFIIRKGYGGEVP